MTRRDRQTTDAATFHKAVTLTVCEPNNGLLAVVYFATLQAIAIVVFACMNKQTLHQ